nr:hypothetical protein [uncultured Pedobacter sp.]
MNLKRFSIVLLLALSTITSQAQNPTLAVGLETLTMNKGTIDVEALTEIIMEKQKELKQEALKRFMLSLFPETNYTTKFYVQNCLTILLNEKNPQVIEKEILELTTNYALVLGIAKAYNSKKEVKALQDFYIKNKMKLTAFRGRIFRDKVENKKEKRGIENRLVRKSGEIDSIIDGKENLDYKKLLKLEKERARKAIKFNRLEMKDDINYRQVENVDSLPFGLLVDVVAAALSGMEELKVKGFFKRPIDYKQDRFYLNLNVKQDSALKSHLNRLQDTITAKVKPYISHYDVIKEYFSVNLDDKDNSSIPAQLMKKFTDQIIEMAGGEKKITAMLPVEDKTKLGEVVYSALQTVKALNGHRGILKQMELTINQIEIYNVRKRTIKVEIELVDKLVEAFLVAKTDTLDTVGLEQKKMERKEKLISLENEVCLLPQKITDAASELSNYKKLLTLPDSLKSLITPVKSEELDKEDLKKYTDNYILVGQKVDNLISNNIHEMIQSGKLLKIYLDAMLKKMLTLEGFKLPRETDKELSSDIRAYSESISEIFVRLNQFTKQEVISLKDVRYIDEIVIPNFIKYSVLFSKDSAAFSTSVEQFRLLSAFLKISAISPIKFLGKYDKELGNLLGFISNLDNLDRAESYQYMINLLQDTDEKMEKNLEEGKFKDIYLLFSNAVKKYTIINTNEQYVNIDVVSFLNELTQYFNRNNTSRFGIYATLGLNQNFFPTPVKLPGTSDNLDNIGFASEKLGVKFRLHSFNRYRGYENTIKTDVNLNKRAPFINEIYMIAYGSGLLYSLANTATDKNFDYAHAGVGFGLRFYNALDVNLVAGFPFIKGGNPYKNAFLGIGLDIPLGEYLEKIGNKKK